MLTIKIEDSRLEKRIADKARLIGKSAQEIVNDLLMSALPDQNEELSYQKLDPKENGYLMDASVEGSLLADDVTLYDYVTDSAKYTETLRKNSWRKQ